MNKEKTKVIFRQWKIGCEIIALMPEITGDITGSHCRYYMRNGQQGAAHPNIIANTKPAVLEDGAVKKLITELEDEGYDLAIIKRFRYTHLQTRMANLK